MKAANECNSIVYSLDKAEPDPSKQTHLTMSVKADRKTVTSTAIMK